MRNKVIKFIRYILAKIFKLKKQVFFDSFSGKQYSDSPRAISEKMHELYPDVKCVWVLNENVQDKYEIIPEYVKIVKKKSFAYFREFACSFAYVTNEALATSMYKKKNQYFVQTWHGDRPLKKILHDAWRGEERPTPVMDTLYTDLCVAASDLGESVYRSAFRYKGEILKVGMPRNDKLVKADEEEKNEIKKRLGLNAQDKIVLFAPTFRQANDVIRGDNIDLKRIVEVLEKHGNNWKCLIRGHSSSANVVFDYNEQFINVSDYFDMADILLITDILISDYSSSPGDFVLCNKPALLALYDYDEYVSKHRELYYSIEDAGYITAYNNAELISIIENYSEMQYVDSCQKVKDYFGIVETGKSAEIVVNKIYDFYVKNIEGAQ